MSFQHESPDPIARLVSTYRRRREQASGCSPNVGKDRRGSFDRVQGRDWSAIDVIQCVSLQRSPRFALWSAQQEATLHRRKLRPQDQVREAKLEFSGDAEPSQAI